MNIRPPTKLREVQEIITQNYPDSSKNKKMKNRIYNQPLSKLLW